MISSTMYMLIDWEKVFEQTRSLQHRLVDLVLELIHFVRSLEYDKLTLTDLEIIHLKSMDILRSYKTIMIPLKHQQGIDQGARNQERLQLIKDASFFINSLEQDIITEALDLPTRRQMIAILCKFLKRGIQLAPCDLWKERINWAKSQNYIPNQLDNYSSLNLENLPNKDDLFYPVFQHLNVGVSQVDLEGNIFFVNPKLCELLGYTQAEILHKRYLDITVPEDFRSVMKKWHLMLVGKLSHCTIRQRYIHKNGSILWVDVTISLVQNEENQPLCFVNTIQDISEHKNTEQQQKQSQSRYSHIFEQTPVAIIEWDTQMRVTAWNPAAERIFGYSRHEALGQLMDFIIPSRHRSHVYEISIKLLMEQGGSYSVNQNLRKNGQEITCEWHNTPLLNEEGNVVAVASHVLDITDRKQAENQLQQKTIDLEKTLHELKKTQTQIVQSEKMSSLGLMVAGLAHEINNPVNFVHANLDHLQGYTQDLITILEMYRNLDRYSLDEIQEKVEEIDLDYLLKDILQILNSMKEGTKRISEIVKSLRIFSRLDEAKIKQVDIHKGIDSTLRILQHRLKATTNDSEIQVIKSYGCLPLVHCYPGQLNQVFMNILSNGIDALEEYDYVRSFQEQLDRPSQITISTSITNRNSVKILIADNGPGISESVRHHIFDPFYTTKPVGKGTGLGLSISYQIITEKHAGVIECFSIEGEGTQFIIEIPLK
ncbi:MAG: PAS domain S-box protein [Cyanobacteriota bacterium]|nr:PAS domain S-box protein [Cyanobacteriota bacterium]